MKTGRGLCSMSIEYYNKNAEEFYNATASADMSETCNKFRNMCSRREDS